MDRELRGVYVARLDLAQPHLAGVAEKIRAQIAAMGDWPARVDLLQPSGGRVLANDETLHNYGDGGLWRRLNHYLLFYRAVAAYPVPLDFLYLRYQGSSPPLLWMLWRLRQRNPRMLVLMEIPTYPYALETATLRERLKSIVDRVCRGRLRKHVQRVITFSREDSIFGIPTIRTDNGVDVSRIPASQSPANGGTVRLLGLANLSFWHGYDRVIAGLVDYYAAGGKREVHFDIIGTGAELDRLRTQAQRTGLEHRVAFHGPPVRSRRA